MKFPLWIIAFQMRKDIKAQYTIVSMWIRSQEHPHLPQFVNITSQYNGTGVVFTFIPQLESEARSIVASIIPYFCHAYGADIKKYFKLDAWMMHEDTYWDPEL